MCTRYIFLLFIICYSFTWANGQPLVTTPRGSLVGFHFDQGNDTTKVLYGHADVFLGVPYALPPLENLRYKYPRPLLQYSGPSPYNATYFRTACIQPTTLIPTNETRIILKVLFFYITQYLNIYTPDASSTAKFPVMVWIHGGSLIVGSGRMGLAGVTRSQLHQGIIVVGIDYRMGWLGFFTTFTDDFPPNIGMLDQTMALRFLKEEIWYFGGDPNRITIFGESAGGHSTSALSYSPLSQNLFEQYIAESGNVFTCYEDILGPTNMNPLFAQVACNYTQEMWDSGNFTALKACLQTMNTSEGTLFADKVKPDNGLCWSMVQDNYFFPGTPQVLGPKRKNIPAIIGTCKDEFAASLMGTVKRDTNLTYFTRQKIEEAVLHKFRAWFGNETKSQQVLKLWEDYYLPPGIADDDHLSWLDFFVHVGTAAYFTDGALKDAEYHVNNKNPNIFLYEFARYSQLNSNGNPLPNWQPVSHGCEVVFLFSYGEGGVWDSINQEIATTLQNAWANFAKHGTPTPDNTWKAASSSNFSALEYFEFNNVSMPKVGYRSIDQVVWNQAIPQILGDYPPNIPDNYTLCQKGYQSKIKNNICYEVFGTPASWTDAQTNCVQKSYGALVTMGSAFENSDILAYAKNTFPSCANFYTGLYKSTLIPNNSNWTWVNYDTNAYRNWKSGFPTQDSNANCVVLNSGDGTWTNQACDSIQCYICSTIF